MIKRKVKYKNLLVIMGIFILVPVFVFFTLVKTNLKDGKKEETVEIEEIEDDSEPVIATTTRIINPYSDPSVKVTKTYYDYKAKEEEQINSIVEQDDTYLQNSGIDYVGEKEFEVLSILDGEVTNVLEDKDFGNTLEIKHNNNLVSIYQTVSSIKVKKGDIITQGQVIATSGKSKNDENYLHFEMYDNGQKVNPIYYFNKEVNLEKKN